MPQDGFELACDRLSHVVDATQFEQLRWSRNEGPMLAQLEALARTALEDRPEFELAEGGATKDVKRFVLKVHGHRIAAISIRLNREKVVLAAEAIARSRFVISDDTPVSADYERFDKPLMAAALMELFERIRPYGEKEETPPEAAPLAEAG